MANTPPLPARTPSEVSLSGTSESSLPVRPRADTVHLTPQSATGRSSEPWRYPYAGGLDDPRATSTQSLRPIESAGPDRRTLLLIYIHGFLGDETSFKSFPAHVHNILTVTLADSHVVHSKIYPRYKSRKNISVARDDFSRWLTPHESPTTDVILIGHSLGGILAAEVVLLPSPYNPRQLRHHILGLIAFDVPFLGMHPGVVSTGIASLFRSPPEKIRPEESAPGLSPRQSSSPRTASIYSDLSADPADPNFNPAFINDVHLANRIGKFERGWYFWNKHWGELAKATQNYVTSHLEFGGCLADYAGLRRRYDAIRALEDVDEYAQMHRAEPERISRVRFVNYYSASTGRIKERSPSQSPSRKSDSIAESQLRPVTLQPPDCSLPATPGTGGSLSPRLSVEEHRNGMVIPKELEEVPAGLEHAVQEPGANDSPKPLTLELSQQDGNSLSHISSSEFPPLPPLPDPPPLFDQNIHSDPDARKLAKKEHERQIKGYERAKRDRDKTLRDREKLRQKRDKQTLKEQVKAKKEAGQQLTKHDKEQLKRAATLNVNTYDKHLQREAETPHASRKQKDRKFCTLPAKDPKTGVRDPTWVRIYMEGIDEVLAHTSMFKMSETYATLVGDTASRVEGWIADDATRRLVLEASKVD